LANAVDLYAWQLSVCILDLLYFFVNVEDSPAIIIKYTYA